MRPLYKIFFIDGKKFIGGNLINTKWMEIPNKPIRKIIYYIPNTRQIICEENFEKIYHFVEATIDFLRNIKGQQLEYTYLIVKRNTIYKVYKINLKSRQIEVQLLDEKDNFIQRLNPIGWK